MKKHSLTPIKDFVVIIKDEAVQKTAGGLFMPGNIDNEKIVTGTVISVGPGWLTTTGVQVPLEVQVDDKVYFNKSMATELKVNEQQYFLIREENILAKIS